MKTTTLKMMLLSAMLLMGVSMVSCSDKDEEELIFGNETVEIDFNKDGEPEFNPSLAIDESFLNQHLGRVANLSLFHQIRSDGSIDESSPLPSKLYGISNPKLYFKDRDTLIIFNEQGGIIRQYYKMIITIDMEKSVIRSEGKYVAQLRDLIAHPGWWSRGLFYFGEERGQNQYVIATLEFKGTDDIPTGLDKL